MTTKILLLYSHPHPSRSRLNQSLVNTVADLENVTVHRLYELYPDFQIDIAHEQQLLLDHDVIVFQHPMYWYSSPAILKEWQDTVLKQGFAYGEGGTALSGKYWQSVITTGSTPDDYTTEGLHRFTLEELLRPFEQTAHLCHMLWQPPRILSGGSGVSAAELQQHCQDYRAFLQNYCLPEEN